MNEALLRLRAARKNLEAVQAGRLPMEALSAVVILLNEAEKYLVNEAIATA